MTKQGLGRDQIHDAAWGESYPHPLISCMMPLVAILAVLAVLLFGLQIWQITLPRDTFIPQIEGLKVTQATEALRRAGLEADIQKERQASETIPNDAVISADPASGRRVKKGRVIRLVISSGSAYTTVPDTREVAKPLAHDRIQQAGLIIGKEEYQNNPTIPFDRVISQTPKPGSRVKRQSAVNLVFSKGVEKPLIDETPTLRSTTITVVMPKDATEADQTRIDVTDDDGTRTVYEQEHEPGDKVVETVQGNGPMTIQVYFGDELILTKKY